MKSIMQKAKDLWSKYFGETSVAGEKSPPSISIYFPQTKTCTVRGLKYKVMAGDGLVVPLLPSDKDVAALRAGIAASFVLAESAMSKAIAPVTGLTTMTDLTKKDVKMSKVQLAGSKLKGEPKKAAKPAKEPQVPTLASRVEAFFKKSKSTKGMRVGQVLKALNLPKEKEAVLRTAMFNLKSKGVLVSPAKGLFVRGTK